MFIDTVLTTTPTSPADLCRQVESDFAADHIPLKPYQPTPAVLDVVEEIRTLFKYRQNMMQARTKIVLQAQAVLRLASHEDGDFDTDEAKAEARKRAEKIYREVSSDPEHPYYARIEVYEQAIALFEERERMFERSMVKAVKSLPIYDWAKSVKGLGDVSLACIIGAAGDIGSYRSVSALWKRMGLAVDANGNRQGNPGKDATKEDWIAHGYSPRRRSVMWNVGNSLILGMGKFRPIYGEDVDANPEYTYLQKVFANRARYEAKRLPKGKKCKKTGAFLPELDESGNVAFIVKSATGKDSYSEHAANRAKRYTEKRLLKMLYLEWRKAA